MIGAKEVSPEVVDNYFGAFVSSHPDDNFRRMRAKSLLPGQNPGQWDHPSRTILAAQWADKYGEARETARLLYSLHPTLTHYAGHSVLKLTGIQFDEIKNLRKGGKLPPYGFSIDVGAIDEETRPEYGFSRPRAKHFSEDVVPDATFLGYRVTLPVVAIGGIDVNPDGKAEFNSALKERADFEVYSGRVCLEADRTLYRKTRHREIGSQVFGNGRSFGVMYELLDYIGGPQNEAFRELFASEEISPEKPLINLGPLAA
jgi:hypothetical protein